MALEVLKKAQFMSILVYEDMSCDALAPISTGRIVASITCGSVRLLDLLQSTKADLYGICRPYLKDIQQSDFQALKATCETPSSTNSLRLMISGRVVPSQQI